MNRFQRFHEKPYFLGGFFPYAIRLLISRLVFHDKKSVFNEVWKRTAQLFMKLLYIDNSPYQKHCFQELLMFKKRFKSLFRWYFYPVIHLGYIFCFAAKSQDFTGWSKFCCVGDYALWLKSFHQDLSHPFLLKQC